jgi:hypothetical protein
VAIPNVMHMWRGLFDEFSFEVDEYIDAGDTLIMPAWITVRARGSSAEVGTPEPLQIRAITLDVRDVEPCTL